MSHKTYITCADRPFNTMGAETLRGFFLTLSLAAVVSLSFTAARTRGGIAAGLTAPFQIAFLGQRVFLFRCACGQSHGEASGPKVSLSIIPILHCKQSGCLLPRFVPDTEISSSSAADKIISVLKWQTEIAVGSTDSSCVFGPCHTMSSQKSHRSLKIVVKFQSEALHGGCCVSPSYRNRCFHTEQPGCLMGCFKGHCFSVIRGGSPEIHHAGPASTMQELRCPGATDSPLSDQLELQNCGFSFDLRTKETGFFIIGTI